MMIVPPLDTASCIRRAPEIASSVLHGEVVMVDLDAGLYFGLDDIGSEIWHCLEREMRVSDLIAHLAKRYDASSETIERDVLALLRQLQERRLLVVVDAR